MKTKLNTPLAGLPLRRRAETRLHERTQTNGAGPGKTKSIADTQRLLHELQVHQIELEMQNEELRKARDEMEAGLEKYSELYDFAPMGYLTLDRTGAIREANLAAADLLGIARAPLMKQRFAFFLAPVDRPLFNAFLKQIFEGRVRKECDVMLLLKGQLPVDVRVRANCVESGEACRMAITDITQHKVAEAATAQLAAIVTSSSDAIIGQDLHGVVTSWNAGAVKLFGYSAGEMVGSSMARLIPSDRESEETEIINKISQGKSVDRFETVRAAKNGQLLDVSVTISALRYAGRKIAGVAQVARDISETKQTADKVRISEIRYRRLFEAAHDGVLLLDPITRKITDANPFMAQLLSYPGDYLIGKELFEIGLLKDEAASKEMFRKLKRKHEIRYENMPLETQGGRHQEVEVVANLYQENGHAVIQCNIRDITQRKASENALIASEERFRVLFDLGPVAVYSCDATGVIREFNRCAEKLWGRSPKLRDRRDRFCGSVKMYLPDGSSLPHRKCPMAHVLSGKLPAARDLEIAIERPDASIITVIVNIVPLKNNRGEITGAINCFYDITGRKRAADALRKAREQLAQHAGKLQELVAERTAKLRATNKLLEDSVSFIKEGREKYRSLFTVSQDIQMKLRRLTHQIITAQEDERKQISRELHDVVVQTLVGINVELSALSQGANAAPRSLKLKIAHTQRLVENSVNAVHRFARELRPAVLDDLGLIPALHAYTKNVAARKKLKIKLTAFAGVEALDGNRRTVLYRVAQEALTNITRHAQASEVRLNITKLTGAVRMEIHDNGKSFKVPSTLSSSTSKRLGLLGMQERVEMVGGHLAIESAPGLGTTVRAEIPFGSRDLP